MTSALGELGTRFVFNGKLLEMIVEGFGAPDWSRRPGERGGNTAHWILGHIVTTRRHLMRKLGAEVPEDAWEASFAQNSRGGAGEELPPTSDLAAEFKAGGPPLARLLKKLTPKRSSEEWGGAFPDGGKTIADGARFLYFHETYHLGQLGLIRRICGHPGFV